MTNCLVNILKLMLVSLSKPWWNSNLSRLWNKLCEAERKWLKGSIGPVKNHLKGVFISARKDFDREVQKCKRAYWVSLKNE
jgi:hypothetical protein